MFLASVAGDAIDHAHQLLKKVGLSEKHAQYPGQLSGGQQQRAAIARTLAMRPKSSSVTNRHPLSTPNLWERSCA